MKSRRDFCKLAIAGGAGFFSTAVGYPKIAKGTPALFVAGASAAISAANLLLGQLSVTRKIAIVINNHTGWDLVEPKYHLYSGTTKDVPTWIPKRKAAIVLASKTSSSARGTAGVITYRLNGADARLAILWSIPYDYNLYENWFATEMILTRDAINGNLFDRLYNGPTVKKASNGYQEIGPIWNYYRIGGTMGTAGDSVLNINYIQS
ncbi:hypothetical protein PN480_05950 [Dolichospermum circinale CS-1225]|uniref:hypothetical protein n=1 Tax=Dolichospermum circinale TaxID=109265 RepID=UPI0023307C13|nr:hypothetical protein [Dolichospermum circinale]MDB9460613.1 hypothetical protein [Dolichospermum circinale CS-545/17]MDB9466845.1 hypothetical protein [Dolichospermum circinale CS-539/09]MDB9471878.1 hypothetical protein [Dolichospermum circinale CS-539]MDB9521495.1 hypothetical protein [Dolichospermum circinale CS-1225]